MQIDLTERSGFPIALDLETGELIATGDVDLGERGERRLSQLRDFLAEPDAATDDRVCYRTYRGVGTKSDLMLLEEHGLRYDLTVTLPGFIGREFMKTAGHYHSAAPDGAVYPEIYEVLYGQPVFIMQVEVDPSTTPCVLGYEWFQELDNRDVVDHVVIPPDWGHITVNVGTTPLVVSDLIAADCKNDYGSFRSFQGAVYYVGMENGRIFVRRNPRYVVKRPENPTPVFRGPDIRRSSSPLKEMFHQEPYAFKWLTSPSEFTTNYLIPWRFPRASVDGVTLDEPLIPRLCSE